MFKIMQDIETAGLDIYQQIELLERSLQQTVNPDFKFDGNFCSHLILPDFETLFKDNPNIKTNFDAQFQKAIKHYQELEEQQVFAKGEEKRSKVVPESPLTLPSKQEIERYLKKRGIEVVWLSHLDLAKAKFTYNHEALIEKIEEIRTNYKQTGLETGFSAEARGELIGLPVEISVIV